MDYHSLERKELQSLCKKHKIPANMTNLAMADALSALNLVDGVESTGKSAPESPVASKKPTARKPQSDLIDNEPKIKLGLARTRRAPLHENASASEEAIIPKTSVPRTCQEKDAGKLVSKAKENNNGKETEVPVITRRSTRAQQKSTLNITEPVLKVGRTNETDRLSIEVNVDKMKSECVVTDDDQQKNDGINGNSSKEEQDDVVSGNVDGVEKTGKSLPESPVTSRKSTARKPQPDLIDNEPRIRVGLARCRRAPLLQNSFASEESIAPKTLAPRTCQEKAAGELVSKESNNGKETEVPVITRRSTRVQQKSKLKRTEPVLKVGVINEADILPVEVNAEEMESESEVADDVRQKRDGTNGNSSKEEHDDVDSTNVDGVEKTGKSLPESPVASRKSTARKPQPDLIDNEPRICVGLARSRRAPLLENSSASEEAIIPKTSALRTCQEKAAGELVSKAKESINGKETEVPVITRRSTRVQLKSKLKTTEPVLKVGGINEADMLPVEVNVEEMKSESEVANDVQQKRDGTNGNSSKEEHDDVVSANVDGVEKTGKSLPESSVPSRKSTARKPQPDLINEPRIRAGLHRSRRAPLLEDSSASEEAIIPKTSAPRTCQEKAAGELVSKAKESNNGKKTEVPVITRRSTRAQQKTKLKTTEPVLKVGRINEADMLPVEVNVQEMKSESELADHVQQKSDGTNGNSSKEGHDDVVSGNIDGVEKPGKSLPESPVTSRKSTARKPQPDLIDNEPRIRVGLARSRCAPLLENSSASEEAIIPKTSAPRSCLEKAAGELVSKAKESNNGKETEVPVITRRSTRVHQKSKLKRAEHVLKVGGKNETDMLSIEVNVDKMKSKSEVTDDDQQKNDGTNGNSSNEEHDDVVSGNISSAMVSTEFSILEKPGDFEEITVDSYVTSEDPSTALIMGELSESSTTHAFGESTSEDCSASTISVRESSVNVADVPYESPLEEKTEIAKVHTESEDQPTEVNEVLGDKCVLEVNGHIELTYAMVTKAETLSVDESSLIVEKMDRFEVLDVVDTNGTIKCETELYNVKVNDVEELSLDSDCFSFEAMRESTEEVMNNLADENCNLDAQPVEHGDQLMENEVIEDKAGAHEMELKVRDENELTSAMVIEVEAHSVVGSSPIDENMEKVEGSDADEEKCKLECETGLFDIQLTEVEALSVVGSSPVVENTEKLEDSDADKGKCKLECETGLYDIQLTEVEALSVVGTSPIVENMEKLGVSDADEGKCKLECETELYDVQLIECEALSVKSSPIVENTEKSDDSYADEGKCKLKCESAVHDVQLTEVEELSSDSKAMEDFMKEVINNLEDKNCYLDVQSMVCEDHLMESEVIEDKGVNVLESKVRDENELTYVMLSEVKALSVGSSPIVVNTENLEVSHVDEVASKLECETEICVVNVSEIEELSLDSDEAMKDLMKEVMNNQEAQNLTFKIQQEGDCDRLSVAADFDTTTICDAEVDGLSDEETYDKENDSDVELVISDAFEENEKDNSGDTVNENEDSFYVVEITDNLEDSEVYEVASELECETEIHVNVSELEELSMDSDCFYFEAMKDLMEEVMYNQEAKNCTLEIQQNDDCDKFQCVNVAADVDTAVICDAEVDWLCDQEASYDEETDSDVELAISDAAEEIEKDNSGDAVDENEESDADEMTENLEELEVYEVASKFVCETEIYAVNISELEELSMDSDCFYFEAMKDLMEEVLNNQEVKNCTFEIQQDYCDKLQCVNVATDFDTTAICNAEVDRLADKETSYNEENSSDVELVISDTVEENQKDNSGDTVDKNEDNPGADEISNVVATEPTVKQTPVPLATPNKIYTSANHVQEIPWMSSTKKKVATTSRSFIRVLDDNKKFDEIDKFSIRSTSKVGTKVVLEEKGNKLENTAQRKLKATSLGQLRKMMKQLNPADTNNTVVKEQLHMEKRPALQQLSNNSLVHEKEN